MEIFSIEEATSHLESFSNSETNIIAKKYPDS